MILKIIALDFGLQAAGFIYSAYYKTEKYYDLIGSLTYQSCTLTMLYANRNSLSSRSLVAGGMVLLWSGRLGSYLYSRVQMHADTRFDKIKNNPLHFGVAWFMQGTWVALMSLPTLLCIAQKTQSPLGWLDLAGILVWGTGFALESIADYQKSAFKAKHPKDFCNIGVWKYCRYPNYSGEIALWIGSSMLCWGGLSGLMMKSSAVISPIFLSWLITKVSGVNLSEKSQAKSYGHRKDYQDYVRRTNKYFPWFPKAAKTD